MSLAKLVAHFFGIGYIGSGGGTVAAAVLCLAWFFLPASDNYCWQVFLTVAVIAAGIWSGNKVDAIWGKDSNKVVIDEVAGMALSLVFIPATLPNLVAALVLFRFFDIVKPLFIRRMELLPKGWGVMADDLLSGIYANLLMQLIVYTGFYKNLF